MAFIPGLLELQFIENEGMAFWLGLTGHGGQIGVDRFRLVAAVGIRFLHQETHCVGCAPGFLTCLAFIWARRPSGTSLTAQCTANFSPRHWGLIAEWAGEGYAPFMMGHVVDMFHFTVRWPSSFPIESLANREVFPPIWNLADAAISCGVIAI